MHRTQGWEGQLARVSRWLDRLMNTELPNESEDFLYAFFQNAYHLKDWRPGNKNRNEIDTFLDSNLATRICRDIANLTKHFELERRPAQEYEPSIVREFVGKNRGWYEGDSRLVILTNYEDNGVVLDAREVARECMRLWCDFLPPNELILEIRTHFKFSADSFDRVLAEAMAVSEWGKQMNANERTA